MAEKFPKRTLRITLSDKFYKMDNINKIQERKRSMLLNIFRKFYNCKRRLSFGRKLALR